MNDGEKDSDDRQLEPTAPGDSESNWSPYPAASHPVSCLISGSEAEELNRYREIVRSADVAIFSVNSAGRIRQWNPAAERLYGYTESEIVGQSVDVLIPPIRQREWRQIFNSVRAGTAMHHLATVRRTKAGREIWIGFTVCPLRQDGDIVGASLFSRGLNARMQEDERFRQAVESAPNAMLLVDSGGAISMVNREAERLFGYAASELLGQPVERLVPAPARASHRGFRDSYLSMAAKRSMGKGRDVSTMRKDGSLVPVEIGLNPIGPDPDPSIMVSVVDVSERKAAEAMQSRLNQSLKDALSARDLFLSVASHELKTPIATLKLTLQAMQQGKQGACNGGHDRRLASCVRQVNRMAELVEQLLDVSRIQNSQLELQPEKIDLGALVSEIVDRFTGAGTPSRIEIGYDPGVIGTWDRSRIDQAIVNLLSNALKYGNGKPIEIGVRCTGDVARVSVRDQGIGIPEDEHRSIFERFGRARASEPGGFGLGLWLTKSYVEAHGGRVAVTSQVGVGSTFEISLPLQRIPDETGGHSEEDG